MSNGSGRRELYQKLRKLGVKTVTAQYDGCGDSGQIEDPEFGPVEVPPALVRAVHDLFYDLLEAHYAGWEINEGSFGQFEWDLGADSIALEHSTRTYETEEQVL